MAYSKSINLYQVSEDLDNLVYVGDGSPDAGGDIVDIRIISEERTISGEVLFEELIEGAVRASLLMRSTNTGKQEVRDILLNIIEKELQ